MRVFFYATTPQLPMYSSYRVRCLVQITYYYRGNATRKVFLIYAPVEVYMLFRQKVHGGCVVIVHMLLLLLLI